MKWSEVFSNLLIDLKKNMLNSSRRYQIGWTCSYVPTEIVEALNLIPIRVLPDKNIGSGDSYLDPNLCPYIKASIGDIISGEYGHISGFILTNSCDGMRRLFDAIRFYHPSYFYFLLDVPRFSNESTILFFKDRLKGLMTSLEKYFSIKMCEDDLIESINNANETRKLLRKLFSLQGMGLPPLQHSDILEIIKFGYKNERYLFNEALLKFLETIRPSIKQNRAKRIMITGSLFIPVDIIRIIENLGADVIYSDICTGERILEEVSLDSDPLFSLSKTYLGKFPCARMLNSESRFMRIIKKIEEGKVSGVIYYTLKFCDPYLYEVPGFIERLRSKNIRVLSIEGEYTSKVSESIRTRIQAFLETMD